MSNSIKAMMLGMLASMKPMKELVEDSIKSLDDFKKADFRKDYDDSEIFQNLSLLLLKLQQGDQSPVEIMMESMKMGEITDKAAKLHEKEHPEDYKTEISPTTTIPEDYISQKEVNESDDDDDEPPIIMMGPKGEA